MILVDALPDFIVELLGLKKEPVVTAWTRGWGDLWKQMVTKQNLRYYLQRPDNVRGSIPEQQGPWRVALSRRLQQRMRRPFVLCVSHTRPRAPAPDGSGCPRVVDPGDHVADRRGAVQIAQHQMVAVRIERARALRRQRPPRGRGRRASGISSSLPPYRNSAGPREMRGARPAPRPSDRPGP